MAKAQIYGVSSKFNFGRWEHTVYHFYSMEAAEKWLQTEEYDFREREITTKTAAIKLAGRKAVENAVDVRFHVIERENRELVSVFSDVGIAMRRVQDYEAYDRNHGQFQENFYNVVDENGCTITEENILKYCDWD